MLDDKSIDRLFGGHIRTHRNYAGLTLNELAWKSGVNAARLQSLEEGKTRIGVRPREVRGLAAALKLDESNLFTLARGGNAAV